MKRVLSVLSALCLLITFLPTAITAETYENLTYSVTDEKVTITDCAESATGELVIPATIAGYPVTKIGMSAFEDCTGLTEIVIGENVTAIGTYAFAGCTQLTSITVGNKVAAIGSGAFAGCTNLSELTVAEGNPVYHSAENCIIETSSKTLVAGCKNSVIPTDGSVTAIGRLAFYKCSGLAAVTIPDCVVSIDVSAFEGCTQLAAVTMGNGVTSIGSSAFLGCTALTEAVIPDSVTTMDVYAFSGCTGLTSVTIGNQVTAISNYVFSGCTELKSVTIGNGVISIGRYAFNGCSKLADIALPNGVTTIDKFAFYNCEALANVQIPGSVSTIGSNAFAGCAKLSLSIKEENTYAISYAQNNGIPHTTVGIGNLAVTSVVLRPSEAGVYFASNLAWAENDTTVLSYGLVASTANPLPEVGSDDSVWTQGCTSSLIRGFLDPNAETADNARNAKTKTYARVYVQLANGEYVYSDVIQITLKQVVIGAQNKWDKLNQTQKDALAQMYSDYKDVMSSWNVPNLK